MSRLLRRLIFIQIRSVVLGIHHLKSCLYYELFYYTRSYAPLFSLFLISDPFVIHLIMHMFHTSVIPYISSDEYFNPKLYTTPNMQNMRFFCCSVYIHIHTYVRILMYVCMFTCVNTCLHRLAYVRISMYIISTCTLAYMDAYTHTRLQSLCICKLVRTNTHIHANAQKISCIMHAYPCALTAQMYICT